MISPGTADDPLPPTASSVGLRTATAEMRTAGLAWSDVKLLATALLGSALVAWKFSLLIQGTAATLGCNLSAIPSLLRSPAVIPSRPLVAASSTVSAIPSWSSGSKVVRALASAKLRTTRSRFSTRWLPRPSVAINKNGRLKSPWSSLRRIGVRKEKLPVLALISTRSKSIPAKLQLTGWFAWN